MTVHSYLGVKRVSVTRIYRYLVLWVLYFWQKTCDKLGAHPKMGPITARSGQRAAPASNHTSEPASASVVLHRKLLEEISTTRPDLGLNAATIAHLMEFKTTNNLFATVDSLVSRRVSSWDLANALYMLLLRRLPDRTEGVVYTRNPRDLLITILSGAEYQTRGRRIISR